MAITDIENEIRKEGSNRIKKINEVADSKVKIIEQTIERYAKSEADRVMKENSNKSDLMRRQIIADANIKAKQMIENEKNNLINQVFDNAKMQILGAKDDEKKAILDVLAGEGKKSIKDADVLIDKKYSKLLKGSTLQDLGDFGVVIQSRDGKIRIDRTLNNSLKQMEVRIRPKLAEALFA